MTDKYYTVAQAAGLLDLHPKTIQKYIREGRLKAQKIGKEWRITGHDLSVFAEGSVTQPEQAEGAGQWQMVNQGLDRAKVSAVIDVEVPDKNEAMRVMNTLIAFMNGRPPEYGQASLSTQYIEAEHRVRIIFWGGPTLTEHLAGTIAMLIDNGEEET